MNDDNGERRFIGKYRGVVADNADPQKLGRIKAKVPDVFGSDDSGWALPCVPYAGKGVGLFLIPPANASVWIEFEHGNPDYPVWSGCFWAQDEPPASPAVADKKMLKTDSTTITLDDTSGSEGITLETANGQKITLNSNGIEIDNGNGATVKMSSQQVNINSGALEVQ